MTDKVSIGFIGAGGIARAHVKRLMEIPEAEIVALAEPSEAATQRMVEEYPHTASAAVFADYRDMLAQTKLDAVEIHTPHTQHFEQGMDVVKAGKHLLMEKPLVCTTPHAHALIAQAKQSGVILMLSYQRHLQGPYIYIHRGVAIARLASRHPGYLATAESAQRRRPDQ